MRNAGPRLAILKRHALANRSDVDAAEPDPPGLERQAYAGVDGAVAMSRRGRVADRVAGAVLVVDFGDGRIKIGAARQRIGHADGQLVGVLVEDAAVVLVYIRGHESGRT